MPYGTMKRPSRPSIPKPRSEGKDTPSPGQRLRKRLRERLKTRKAAKESKGAPYMSGR